MNIAAFAKRCGLGAHTLRYYERIGLLGSVTRQANGHRTFALRDVEWVEFLHRLRAAGASARCCATPSCARAATARSPSAKRCWCSTPTGSPLLRARQAHLRQRPANPS